MADLQPGGAVDLDGPVDDLLGHLGCEQLGHGCRLGGAPLTGVMGVRGVGDQQPRGLDLGGHVGQAVADGLEVPQ